MFGLLSRRRLLGTVASASLITGAVPSPPAAAAAQAATAIFVERRIIEVDGRTAHVFGIRQSDGTHGLTLDPGQSFDASVSNRCGEATIIHWHGQTPPFLQDGVGEVGGQLIEPNTTQRYTFPARSGTHWMHSHHGLQEQALMAAPLIVRTAEDMRADMQDVTILLHDFSFLDPTEVFARVTGPIDHTSAHASMPGMNMKPDAAKPDLNDFDYDAYLANDRTLADPQVIRTARGGRVRLRVINGATATAFWIDTGELNGTVIAADGNDVRPVPGRRFPLAQGQRLDIIVTIPPEGGAFPILAQREGDRHHTGVILATANAAVRKLAGLADVTASAIDNSLEQKLVALNPLAPSAEAITHRIALTGTMAPYAWSIDNRSWANRAPLRVGRGKRVVIEMSNTSQMAHPMHLHGHHFKVIALDRTPLDGAIRDTVLVPVGGSVTIAFDADNPGKWVFHCHNLFHMATGMMTEVVYDENA
jgi:FtsP/CotA-like multicopper oxidase with cupredoxin domain